MNRHDPVESASKIRERRSNEVVCYLGTLLESAELNLESRSKIVAEKHEWAERDI